MFIFNRFFVLLLFFSFSSCNQLEKKYCLSLNFYKLGFEEAKKGLPEKAFEKAKKRCEKYKIKNGIVLDEKEYKRGREKGLKQFCIYDIGYDFGLKGKKYLQVCKNKKTETEFLKGYKAGDKKCLYEDGYATALNGKINDLSSSSCQKLSKKPGENLKEYTKGYKKGLKEFCTYQIGYNTGLKGVAYNKICSKNLERNFLKGYIKGDKKCLYEEGFLDGKNGKSEQAFSSVKCQNLSKKRVDYDKGRAKGLEQFCVYEKGYNLGVQGYSFRSVCPKPLNTHFFKGYNDGFRDYKEEQKRQELLNIERERLYLEQQRLENEKKHQEDQLYLEQQRLENEKKHQLEQQRLENEKKHQLEQQRLENERLYQKGYLQVPSYNTSKCYSNVFGKYAQGGGCNAFGCWYSGGGCNPFGCWYSGGRCGATGCSRKAPKTNNTCR